MSWFNKQIIKQFEITGLPAGDQLLDYRQVGDYEIALVNPSYYDIPQIGIQRQGRQFTNIEDQQSREPEGISPDALQSLNEVIDIINNWLQEYGELALGSFNEQKAGVYKELLERAGFNLEQDPNMPMPVYRLS